jgi:hypothetical protein
MDSPPVELRFGILAEGHDFPAWAADCIERLIGSGHARLTTLITPPPGAGTRARPAALPRWYARHWLERRSRALQRVDLSGRLHNAQRIDGAALSAGSGSNPAAESLRAQRLDFVLCFDALHVPAELLEMPRFGVWAFCQERREAPCFREVLNGRHKTRIALERLTRDGAVCLHEGYFATCRASWVNNVDRARFGAADFCARVCAEIAHGGAARVLAAPFTPEQREAPLRNRDLLALLARSAAHGVDKLWELLFHVEIWNVGFAEKSVEQILSDASLEAHGVTWCKPHKPGHFIADPFAYDEQGQTRVLVEDYDQVKGKISSLLPQNGEKRVELAVDFDLPYHMSYPCIFEEDGQVYCIPETYQSRRVSLYRRTPEGWSLVRHLIEGQPVVDPTLFKHEGRYWLLYTLQNDGAWGNQKLYAQHATALDAPWTPHPLNPVKCDIGATRPAGNVFSVGGVLYRPSQDCSNTYGGAVVINRIDRLSPTEFSESSAARIDPIAGSPYPDGFHTLNAMGSGAVFDSKKFEFDWLAWRKNWGRLYEVLQ